MTPRASSSLNCSLSTMRSNSSPPLTLHEQHNEGVRVQLESKKGKKKCCRSPNPSFRISVGRATSIILTGDVQLHTEHHLVRCVEKIQEADDTGVFYAKKDANLVCEHFGLVLDQTLVNDLDCASFLSFFVDSKLHSREVTAGE